MRPLRGPFNDSSFCSRFANRATTMIRVMIVDFPCLARESSTTSRRFSRLASKFTSPSAIAAVSLSENSLPSKAKCVATQIFQSCFKSSGISIHSACMHLLDKSFMLIGINFLQFDRCNEVCAHDAWIAEICLLLTNDRGRIATQVGVTFMGGNTGTHI